ncbi:Obg family GTPase CgtA [Candidatus Tremblaya phenacola]|uniref:Obg family GTPase CgtA n=1 Tax=Candidatus Tremblayella phenacoccinincola TaxID=1010676 RepID=UPI00132F53AD|nr:Obg family GTPase CgtA [Candidatus Tremblaya phenacola]KAH0998280.1 GTP-binding protein Obg [Candidatus Tremblaya phenacola]
MNINTNFIDEAIISIKAGAGGNGSVAFRKEKAIHYKIPDGGDGGDGGDVWLYSEKAINTLLYFKLKRIYIAESGTNGKRNNCTGKKGKDIVIKTPIGTRIIDVKTNKLIIDMSFVGQKVLVAKGGFHGIGNLKLKTTNKLQKNKGFPGEACDILMELLLIADVGILGLPNVGKSTFINSVSKAKSKIANYSFTTSFPVLGVVQLYSNNFIIADIPGLIEDVSNGIGLGVRFLKHLERCKLLLHFVDLKYMNEAFLYKAIKTINNELYQYNNLTSKKLCWLVFNKIDKITDKFYLIKFVDRFIRRIEWKTKYYLTSTINYVGIKKLCYDILYYLSKT